MWPFTKKKEPESISYDFPVVNRYRIKPYDEGRYYVELYTDWYGWKSAEEYKQTGGYGYFTPVIRKTEQLAEKWIAERLASDKRSLEYENKKKEFQKNNPPREVPPYKYVKETSA